MSVGIRLNDVFFCLTKKKSKKDEVLPQTVGYLEDSWIHSSLWGPKNFNLKLLKCLVVFVFCTGGHRGCFQPTNPKACGGELWCVLDGIFPKKMGGMVVSLLGGSSQDL